MESGPESPKLSKSDRRKLKIQQKQEQISVNERRVRRKKIAGIGAAAMAGLVAIAAGGALIKNKEADASFTPATPPATYISDRELLERKIQEMNIHYSEAESSRWEKVSTDLGKFGQAESDQQKEKLAIEKVGLVLRAMRKSENPYFNQAAAFIDMVGGDMFIVVRDSKEMDGFAAGTAPVLVDGRVGWDIGIDRNNILDLEPEIVGLILTHEVQHLRSGYNMRAQNISQEPSQFISQLEEKYTDIQFVTDEESEAYRIGAKAYIYQQGLRNFEMSNLDTFESDAVQLLRCGEIVDGCWMGYISNDPLRFDQ